MAAAGDTHVTGHHSFDLSGGPLSALKFVLGGHIAERAVGEASEFRLTARSEDNDLSKNTVSKEHLFAKKLCMSIENGGVNGMRVHEEFC